MNAVKCEKIAEVQALVHDYDVIISMRDNFSQM